jgi:hypothetical protein
MGSYASLGLSLLQQQAAGEPADAAAAFGGLFSLVIVLDVLNTLIALYLLWRIWFRDPSRRKTT